MIEIDIRHILEHLGIDISKFLEMERAFFEKVVEVDRLKEKLESLEAKV